MMCNPRRPSQSDKRKQVESHTLSQTGPCDVSLTLLRYCLCTRDGTHRPSRPSTPKKLKKRVLLNLEILLVFTILITVHTYIQSQCQSVRPQQKLDRLRRSPFYKFLAILPAFIVFEKCSDESQGGVDHQTRCVATLAQGNHCLRSLLSFNQLEIGILQPSFSMKIDLVCRTHREWVAQGLLSIFRDTAVPCSSWEKKILRNSVVQR